MKNNGSQLKKTAQHSAIYALGTMLRRLTGLVMLPIYTRYLTPSDYGVVELLSMAIEISGILIGLRISQAMFRYYILADSIEEKHQIVSTVFFTVLVSSCFGVGVLLISAEPLSKMIFGNLEYVYEFQLFAFTLATNALTAVGLSYLRARQVPILFVSISIASLLMQVALSIYFVVHLEMHVLGVVYSALISGAIVSTGLSVYVIYRVGLHFSRALSAKLIKFVAPLILASVGAFYVAYADKYFLRLFGSLNDVGLYALASRVSSILATVFEAFNMSWGADRFEIVKKANAKEVFEQVFRFVNAVIISIGVGLALFASDFFRFMTGPEFYPAAYIVPILVLAGIARIYTLFCNFGVLYGEATGVMAEASWIKVVLASIGYVSLVPVLGVYGAAITLAISGFVEFLWVYKRSLRFYDMGLQWRPIMFVYLVAVTSVVVGLLLPEGDVGAFILRIALFLGMLVAIYLMPIWKGKERDLMKAVLRKGSGFILRR